MIWTRPGLADTLPPLALSAAAGDGPRLDTALFDVDGVLIDASRSYRVAVQEAAERIVRVVNGLAEAPSPLVSLEDVELFKMAGGFNNDWDETRLLAGIWTARLREWQGTPEAEIPMEAWARRAAEASAAGRGGVAWMLDALPASALPDADVARWVHDEFYWGSRLMREQFGREPLYASDAEGFVQNEEILLEATVLPALYGLGFRHFGIITGRVGPEVGRAVAGLAARHEPGHEPGHGPGTPDADATSAPGEGIAWYEGPHGRSPFALVVPGTQYAKPDPHALAYAVRHLGGHGGFYIGDTADDLDLVLRYRKELLPVEPDLPPMLAMVVASGAQRAVYQERGADLVLDAVGELPAALTALANAARNA